MPIRDVFAGLPARPLSYQRKSITALMDQLIQQKSSLSQNENKEVDRALLALASLRQIRENFPPNKKLTGQALNSFNELTQILKDNLNHLELDLPFSQHAKEFCEKSFRQRVNHLHSNKAFDKETYAQLKKPLEHIPYVTLPQQAQPSVNHVPATNVAATEIMIKPEDVVLERELGRGSFGTVSSYRVTNPELLQQLRAEKLCAQDDNRIALKEITVEAPAPEEVAEFNSEQKVNNALHNRFKNAPNASINLCKSATLGDKPVIVSRLEENGKAIDYLKKQYQAGHATAPLLKNMMQQFHQGIKNMHGANLLHRDIAARNVLLDKNMQVKLGDMGFAAPVGSAPNDTAPLTTNRAPIRWMSEDYLRTRESSRASDMYAAKVAMLEFIGTAGGMKKSEFEIFKGMNDNPTQYGADLLKFGGHAQLEKIVKNTEDFLKTPVPANEPFAAERQQSRNEALQYLEAFKPYLQTSRINEVGRAEQYGQDLRQLSACQRNYNQQVAPLAARREEANQFRHLTEAVVPEKAPSNVAPPPRPPRPAQATAASTGEKEPTLPRPRH